MHRIRRGVAIVAIGAAFLATVVAPSLAGTGEENAFVSRINASRSAAGLEPLEVYWDLVDDARAWSAHMADVDTLSHNPNLGGVTTGWYALGENVGVGPGDDVVHEAFTNSPGHRANSLGDFTNVGAGVVWAGDTKMYVTVVFMKGPDDLLAPTTTTTVPPSTTTTASPTTTTTTAPAPTTTTTTAPTTTTTTVPAPTTTTTTTTTPIPAASLPMAGGEPVPQLVITAIFHVQNF